MKVVCMIPARLESTRMKRKLLRDVCGWSLIERTVEAADKCNCFDEIIVATDSEDIEKVVDAQADAATILTGECLTGSDRIAEAIKISNQEAGNWQPHLIHDGDLIVNIQADEPEIQPEHIRALIDAALMVPGCDMATLAAPLKPGEQRKQNVVKVSVDPDGFAAEFSRSYTIDDPPMLHHLGVYAYTPRFLKWFTSLPQTPSEQRERLEQLRALDNGARIRVAVVPEAWPGIDTEEEYQAFVKRYKERQCQTT